MAKYIRPRGTLDYYENESYLFEYLKDEAKKVCELFGYKMITTPTIESTSLYTRSAGDTSDIVTKEMYNFKDKGERDITLRPEGTAGIIRAVVENKLYATNDLPLKYAYIGPFFRYDRPQIGRYREFYQFGIELIGTKSYLDDIEIILLLAYYLKQIDVKDYVIRINTFGNVASRNKHRDNVKNFFSKHLDNLCEDCKTRFEKNPLRILDCKVDAEYIKTLKTPRSIDALDDEAKAEFDEILKKLDQNNINYVIDEYLVRGLDYYTGLIFEVDFKLADGHILTIGGGGRYSALVKEMDGPDIDCIGFGIGLNRIMLTLQDLYGLDKYAKSVDYYIMPFEDKAYEYAYKIATSLRDKGYSVIIENNKKSVSSMFKYASKNNINKAIMIGEEEIANNNVKIKDLKTQEQYFVTIDKLLNEGDTNE